MPNVTVQAAAIGLPVELHHFLRGESTPLRQRMEAAIETMLALLDELDEATDMEPDNDDEPSLGWEGGNPTRFASNNSLVYCDGEEDIGEQPEGRDDREYDALESHGAGFTYSGPDDAEDSHDAEFDPAESGVADVDGIAEQFSGQFHGAAI